VRWQDRAHFPCMSARVMRRILVDHARARGANKRGGRDRKMPIEDAAAVTEERAVDLIALDDALRALAVVDPRKSQVVELRFFGGLSIEETAKSLHVSPETVKRDWKVAKVWLVRELMTVRCYESGPDLAGE
jgi:RNA polymerase sigma-70 factor (ECF subfamily)